MAKDRAIDPLREEVQVSDVGTNGKAAAWPGVAAVVGFVLLCAGWYWRSNVAAVLPTSADSDFSNYFVAAQLMLHGKSPFYSPYYDYPPLLACLLTPLAALPYLTARWIWFIFSHICLLAAAAVT